MNFFLPLRRVWLLVGLLGWSQSFAANAPQRIEADLLVVGGNEPAVAAAVQAARLGVKRVVLVSDIAMLGGQFSAEGVGNVDEWTTVNGKRTRFPRAVTLDDRRLDETLHGVIQIFTRPLPRK